MPVGRITRAKPANGISGELWYPAIDEDGHIILGLGGESDEAKRAESRVTVRTENEAIVLLRTGLFWIRMTADEIEEKNLISPGSILVDGQPVVG